MTVRQRLEEILDRLPEEQQRLVLELARFLSLQAEHEDWRHAGRGQFARAYGPDEPEYTEADLKPELNR